MAFRAYEDASAGDLYDPTVNNYATSVAVPRTTAGPVATAVGPSNAAAGGQGNGYGTAPGSFLGPSQGFDWSSARQNADGSWTDSNGMSWFPQGTSQPINGPNAVPLTQMASQSNQTGAPFQTTPDGMDPRLYGLYKQYNLQPGGKGSGFADWQYWQNLAGSAGWDYVLDRLGKDLAGTGSDNPSGTPGTGPWQSSGGGSSAGGSGSTVDINSILNSPLLSPWTEKFSFPDWVAPSAFVAPTGLTEQNDPGYQERMALGTDAVQKAAAAKGILNGGGTLKDLTDYAQTFASNEYQNVYNRAYTDWTTKYNTSLTDWTTNYNKALSDYTQRYNIYEQNQGNQFNRLAALAGLGQTSVGQLSSAGLGYSNNISSNLLNTAGNIGNLYTGAGNAAAAGQVGSANAWNSAFGNLSSLGNIGALYGTGAFNQSSYLNPNAYGGGSGSQQATY